MELRAAGAEDYMDGDLVYVGRDLEAMSFASNYHRWILQVFKPYLGSRLVEVGAGTGSFSEMLLAEQPESLSLVEPSKAMHGILTSWSLKLNTSSNLKIYNSAFTKAAPEIKLTQQPDSIIYVNVLEHISDDRAELAAMHETLGKGGRIFIFVPALPWLYGKFDKLIGHFRRYTKPDLEAKCCRAGFKILRSAYFDFAGIIPWWIEYRLLRSDDLQPTAVRLYDRYIVPVAKATESLTTPPLGKNIILVGERD
jgi:SAM-dependent methyltransferase